MELSCQLSDLVRLVQKMRPCCNSRITYDAWERTVTETFESTWSSFHLVAEWKHIHHSLPYLRLKRKTRRMWLLWPNSLRRLESMARMNMHKNSESLAAFCDWPAWNNSLDFQLGTNSGTLRNRRECLQGKFNLFFEPMRKRRPKHCCDQVWRQVSVQKWMP